MAETLPSALTSLIHQYLAKARASGKSINDLRGVALYNSQKDALLTSLPAFEAAVDFVGQLPKLAERFGDVAKHITLQFAYQCAAKLDDLKANDNAFEDVWEDFVEEIEDPNWTFYGVANLKHFACDEDGIELGDDVSVIGRCFSTLASLGFHSFALERLEEDCMSGFGLSSFVLLVKECVPKSPTNFAFSNSPTTVTKALRAIGALRLIERGDVRIGPMFFINASRIQPPSGVSIQGISIPAFGSDYKWHPQLLMRFRTIYAQLEKLERTGYGTAPGNLDIALRSFMSTYDRWPTARDQQLIDAITALEALLGTNVEISFRLAFRVASLVASTGTERGELFQKTRDFYDARSKFVHGEPVERKQQETLGNLDQLLDTVRILLRSFVGVAADPPAGYARSMFKGGSLDKSLLIDDERAKLRQLLRIEAA